MKYLPPNNARGLIGLLALFSMIVGAYLLWGGGAALLIGGLFMAIDCSADEIVERITKTTRFPQGRQEGQP